MDMIEAAPKKQTLRWRKRKTPSERYTLMLGKRPLVIVMQGDDGLWRWNGMSGSSRRPADAPEQARADARAHAVGILRICDRSYSRR